MQKTFSKSRHFAFSVSALSALLAASCTTPRTAHPEIADPYEPVNRVTWSMNRSLTLAILEPVSEVYQITIPQPVRDSIGNVRNNLGGPLRLTNQALQGRWGDSGRETARFLTNSTLGIGGLFDVATHMDLPGSRGNFNQTFQQWGWQPDTFIMLPFLGPSDNVAAPARVMDIAADPANYIDALQPVAYVTRVHQVSEITENAAPFMRTEPDSYALTRQAWPYLSRASEPDWTLRGAPDVPTLQTLAAARHGARDPQFRTRGKKHFVRIANTGRDLPYNAWIQDGPAPLVFLNPGIGSHRESRNTLALAESFHGMGFSVVTMSGIFHPEFMERGASAPMPGNPRRDREDVLAACTAIHQDLGRKYRRAEITSRTLAGFSLGGFAAIQLAATEGEHAPGSVRFDHYLAIHAPVDLKSAFRKLDGYFNTPNRWPDSGREARMDNLFHKTAGIINGRMPAGQPPFDGEESKTLVGFAFRTVLRDSLYSIHARNPHPQILTQPSRLRREQVHRELMAVSYDDYFRDWLLPAEADLGVSERNLLGKISLRSMQAALVNNKRVTFIGNRNDFLLDGGDIAWINSTFGPRAMWLPTGGHLGNIGDPEFLELLEQAVNRFK